MSKGNWKKILADNLLLFCALLLGIMGLWVSWGSLLLLEVEWTELVRPLLGYGTALYLLFVLGKGKKWAIFKGLVAANIIAAVTGKYWKTIYTAVIRALPDVLESINNRYEKHYTLPIVPMVDREIQLQALLWSSILFLLCISYGILKRHTRLLALMYVLPVLVSFYTITFPKMCGLVMMCLSLGIALCYGRFQNEDMEAFKASCISLLLCGGILVTAYYGCLPFLDDLYEKSGKDRRAYSQVVNEQWLPWARNLLQWDKWFRSSTVKGSLKHSGEAGNDEEDVFRVTVDSKPTQTVYLRGFAGSTYTGISWEADEKKNLKRYYQEKGWELPDDYAQLYNTVFERLCKGQESKALHMEIQEMSVSNKYALYPYGACLPDNGTVYADGVLKRKSAEYEFDYCPVENIDGYGREISEEEEHYREYVYDTYLAYPEEQLPRLSEYLESWNEVTDNVWAVSATVYYLGWNAVYNINAPDTPEDEDFVEYFLFEGREGWCAHFASAAVLILRKLGVPARYVTGYIASPDTFEKEADGTYTAVIRGRQAHAWAEIYLDGWGWVPLEVTPASAAMTEDNRLEVLQTVGDMIGEQNEVLPEDAGLARMPDSERVMDRIGFAQEDDLTEKKNPLDEPEQMSDLDAGKTQDGQTLAGQDKGNLAQKNQNITEDGEKGGSSGKGAKGDGAGGRRGKPAGWLRALLDTVLVTSAAFCLCMLRRGSVLGMEKWYRKHRSTNEQVSWLYRRIQRMSHVVYGKNDAYLQELTEEGQRDVERFERLVERGTFGAGELPRAECREAWRIFRRISKAVYDSRGGFHRFLYRYIAGVL